MAKVPAVSLISGDFVYVELIDSAPSRLAFKDCWRFVEIAFTATNNKGIINADERLE